MDEILADLYSEGRQANHETAEEIINRLEAKKNYIFSSVHARREYSYVLLEEYRKYIADRKNKTQDEIAKRPFPHRQDGREK